MWHLLHSRVQDERVSLILISLLGKIWQKSSCYLTVSCLQFQIPATQWKAHQYLVTIWAVPQTSVTEKPKHNSKPRSEMAVNIENSQSSCGGVWKVRLRVQKNKLLLLLLTSKGPPCVQINGPILVFSNTFLWNPGSLCISSSENVLWTFGLPKKKKKNLLGDVSLEDSSSLNDPAATVVAA